jgi:hypothetical protein
MESCTPATLVEDCFSNFVNKHEAIAMSILQKIAVKGKVRMAYAIFTREIDTCE